MQWRTFRYRRMPSSAEAPETWEKIIDVLRAKNPDIRIVINTIALESISEVLGILKEREIDADIVQICASRSRTLGRYHMMTGQNPVYIISF